MEKKEPRKAAIPVSVETRTRVKIEAAKRGISMQDLAEEIINKAIPKEG